MGATPPSSLPPSGGASCRIQHWHEKQHQTLQEDDATGRQLQGLQLKTTLLQTVAS
jgi:hypothetical protein